MALAAHNGAPAGANLTQAPRRAAMLPHDSPTMAAATEATGIVNRSEKAEAVARALMRPGTASHADLSQALAEAGLEAGRAQAEIVRMLATDFLLEPRPGKYRLVA